MQKLSKVEIQWLIGELDRSAANAISLSEFSETTKTERELLKLEAGNFKAISDKLVKALNNGDKRIELY